MGPSLSPLRRLGSMRPGKLFFLFFWYPHSVLGLLDLFFFVFWYPHSVLQACSPCALETLECPECLEAPSSPSPHLPLHVGVSGRLHPGAGWPETGFQVAAHPGARWPETPNSRGFWPSRTRKPRFSGGELVEAKCIVLYFLRLCYIFLRFSMLLATGPGHLLSAFSRIPKT